MNFSIKPIFPVYRWWSLDDTPFKEIKGSSRGGVVEKVAATSGFLFSLTRRFYTPPLRGRPMRLKFKKRKALQKKFFKREIPIGLRALDDEGIINALVQFLVHVPGLLERSAFLPKSFFALQEFFDRYLEDLSLERDVCQSSGVALEELFKAKFSNKKIEDVFEDLLKLLRPHTSLYRSFENLLYRNNLSEQLTIAQGKARSENEISGAKQAQSKTNSSGCFGIIKGSSQLFLAANSIKKQIVLRQGVFLDLMAFVEKRPDKEIFFYITYVKVGGSWYQCDGERISQTRSDFFKDVLERSCLACYIVV